jgi:hypothetical protein
LKWWFGRNRAVDPAQISLPFEGPPRDAPAFHERLVALGLRGFSRVALTSNATVMVSFAPGVLRVHRSYLDAPDAVHRAIVTFACARRRRERSEARRLIIAHAPVRPADRPRRRREPIHPDDQPLVQDLVRWHQHYNAEHFGGALSAISIRVSRRMRARLGQYAAATSVAPAEISISRSHIRRHGWEEALHTLLHEMVHQWQAESGHPLDHGRQFRAKARDVGIAAGASRDVRASRRRAVQEMEEGVIAAAVPDTLDDARFGDAPAV